MTGKPKFETLALHAGATIDATGSRAVPLYRTSSYVFRDTKHAADLFALNELGNIYTRLQNPTHDVLEKRMAALENGAAALAVASGTSAVFYAAINICAHGDEIVSSKNLYGGTFTMFNDILPDLGLRVVFVDPHDPANFEKAITERTRMLFTETIDNPTLFVPDIPAIAAIAHRHRIPLVVDSTFTTPYLFKPLDAGADVVVHSLTKWLGGHGTAIGGIVVDKGAFDWTDPKFKLYNREESSYHGLRFGRDLPAALAPLAFILRMRLVPLRNLGACISPDNAWMFLQGIETLALRMQRHCENALAVARYMQGRADVAWVRYPGLNGDLSYVNAAKLFTNGLGGGMVVFGIKGGLSAGRRFIESLKLFSHVANVGDAKSLAIHPSTTTHSQLTEEQQRDAGISPDMIRLSIGIEHIDDIISDIEQSLNEARKG